MNKLRSIFLAGAVVVSFAFIVVLASPLTGALVAEQIESGLDSFFGSDDALMPVEYGSDSLVNISSFHWLDPIAPSSGDPSKFDASLLNGLRVDICQINNSDCTLFKTFTAQGSTSEQLRIISNGSTSYYIANWDTSKVKLNDKTYRVTVTLAGLQLASIDLGPSVYNRFGRTWPIKFLIEKDPVLRVRYLHSLGRTAGQVVGVLRSEFGICGDQAKTLLAGDLQPYSTSDIDLAVQGVCQNVIIPSTTKISDEDTRNSLMTYDPITGVMFFAVETQVLRNLSVGDVLVSEPSAAAPYGFLRKLTSIRKNRGQYTLGTVQAKLNEAISQGTLIANGQLLPEQIASTSSGLTYLNPSKASGATKAANAVDVGDNFNFHRDFDVTFDLTEGGGGTTGTGTVHVTGAIDFNAGYDMGMGIETCLAIPPVCVDRVEAHADVDQKSNVHVTGHFNGEVHKEQTIDTIQFSPIVFFIGPIPVVIVPTIDVTVGIDGTANADFEFAANAHSTLKVGAKWTDPNDGGEGWKNIHDFDPLGGEIPIHDLNFNLTVEGWGKANAKLLLYDVAGPGISGRVGLKVVVHTGQAPLWELTGHLVGDVNFSVDIASVIDLAEHSATVLDEPFPIASAENEAPRCSWDTNTIKPSLNVPITLGPSGGGFLGFFDCTDPEGGAVSYRAVSSVGTDNGSGGTIGLRHTFNSVGPRTIHITATDPDNKSTEFDLSLDVVNTPPIITVASASTTVQKGVQYFVTASAYDVEISDFVKCGSNTNSEKVTFAVDSPDQVTQNSDLRTCTAVVLFGQEGSRQVRVQAVDRNGGVSNRTVFVNVTAAPTNPPPTIDLNSFLVIADRGPIDTFFCITGHSCEAPFGASFFNGVFGDYRAPITMSLSASDPNNEDLIERWYCGDIEVGENSDGTFTCDVVSGDPFVLRATVSDGTTTVNSEVRQFYAPLIQR